MTEDEAETKWCPFARVITSVLDLENGRNIGYAGSHNRLPTENGIKLPTHASCCGSACMAWRWHSKKAESGVEYYGLDESLDGYCGLVGKP